MKRTTRVGTIAVLAVTVGGLLSVSAAPVPPDWDNPPEYQWVGSGHTSKNPSPLPQYNWNNPDNWSHRSGDTNPLGLPAGPGNLVYRSSSGDFYHTLHADMTIGGGYWYSGDFGLFGRASPDLPMNSLIIHNIDPDTGETIDALMYIRPQYRLQQTNISEIAPWVLLSDTTLRVNRLSRDDNRLGSFSGPGSLTLRLETRRLEWRHESFHTGGTTFEHNNNYSRLYATNAVGPGLLTINDGARVEMRANQTVAGLAGNNANARIHRGDGTPTLTLNFDDTAGPYTYLGRIGEGGTALNLVKDGTGTQVLAGENTYTGTTLINGGKLQIGDGGTTGTLGTGAVTIGDGATLAFNRGDLFTVDHDISGQGGLSQIGEGLLTLSGGSLTYSGATTVEAGTLALSHTSSNNIPNSARIEVGLGATLDVTGLAGNTLDLASGQTLRGHGTVGGNVTVAGGSLAPGNEAGVGTLTFLDDLDISGVGAGALKFRLGAPDPNDYDYDHVSLLGGDLLIGDGVLGWDHFEFTALDGFGMGTYELFAGDVVGSLSGQVSGTIGGYPAYLQLGSLNLVVIPEPGTFLLLGMALAGGLLGRRRRR